MGVLLLSISKNPRIMEKEPTFKKSHTKKAMEMPLCTGGTPNQ